VTAAPSWTAIEWSTYVHEIRRAGRRLHYVDYGAGPPILLIHGMAGSWQTWLENISSLGEHHRVIAVDLPGFGGSDPLPAGADFGGYVEALESLLEELMIPSVAVFGHSLGGVVALALAAHSPKRVRCVVLVSGGGAELSRIRLATIQAFFFMVKVLLGVPGVSRLLATAVVGRAILWPAVYDQQAVAHELVQQMVPRAVTPGFLDGVRLGSQGLRDLDLQAVNAPVLLAWGREDRILPLTTARQLEARLRASTLVVFDEVGHCAMFEAPRQFNLLAENFLALQQSDHGTPPTDRATARSWRTPSAMGGSDQREGYGDGTVG